MIDVLLAALIVLTVLNQGARLMDALNRIYALIERFTGDIAAAKQAAVAKAVADTRAEYDSKIAELEARIAELLSGHESSNN